MSDVIQKYSDAATLSLAAYVEFLSPDDNDATTRIKGSENLKVGQEFNSL